MSPLTRADELISELLSDPRGFAERGHGYELLQACFEGGSLDSLRPLLRSADSFVQREVAFVVSELGVQGCSLLEDVLPLTDSDDRYVRFHAIESVAVCAKGERAATYMHIVAKLEDPDEGLRWLSMFLMSNAEVSQLQAARAGVEGSSHSGHQQGLRLLLDDSVTDESVLALIHSDRPLSRRYGAVAAGRLYERSPRLIHEAEMTEDGDVVSFVRSFLKSRRAHKKTGDL